MKDRFQSRAWLMVGQGCSKEVSTPGRRLDLIHKVPSDSEGLLTNNLSKGEHSKAEDRQVQRVSWP